MHISKSLQCRCQTIRKAVANYNEAASKLSPPHPPLDWSKVSDYRFIEEFTLLQESRTDLSTQQWSVTANREFVKLRRRILRAKEELTRCEVEARRLHTAILDEERHFTQVLAQLRLSQDVILVALQDFISRRLRINAQVLADLRKLFSLEGFNGDPMPGQPVSPIFRESSHPPVPGSDSDTMDQDHPPVGDGDDMDVDVADEEIHEDLGRLEELFGVIELS